MRRYRSGQQPLIPGAVVGSRPEDPTTYERVDAAVRELLEVGRDVILATSGRGAIRWNLSIEVDAGLPGGRPVHLERGQETWVIRADERVAQVKGRPARSDPETGDVEYVESDPEVLLVRDATEPPELRDEIVGPSGGEEYPRRCPSCGHRFSEHGDSGCAADDEAALGGCDCLVTVKALVALSDVLELGDDGRTWFARRLLEAQGLDPDAVTQAYEDGERFAEVGGKLEQLRARIDALAEQLRGALLGPVEVETTELEVLEGPDLEEELEAIGAQYARIANVLERLEPVLEAFENGEHEPPEPAAIVTRELRIRKLRDALETIMDDLSRAVSGLEGPEEGGELFGALTEAIRTAGRAIRREIEEDNRG